MNTDADNYGLVALLVASDNLDRHDKVAVSKGVEGHTTVGMLDIASLVTDGASASLVSPVAWERAFS
jgi:hypothetical protein